MRLKVLSIIGTRPEAIKMAPVIRELGKHRRRAESILCVTAQHREMLDQVLRLFGIRPDIDLGLMRKNQDLSGLTARAVKRLSEVIEQVQPGVVLVQGDTTTAFAGALAAFYRQVPVGHVEAGLRTRNRYRPFPEEIDRRLVGVLASLHFAPTQGAASALRAEGVPSNEIFVTGNTVIDSLLWTVSRLPSPETSRFLNRFGVGTQGPARVSSAPARVASHTDISQNRRKLVLVTAHRRENFGRPLENICAALLELVRHSPKVEVIYPVHPNPNVREPVYRMLDNQERIHLTRPLAYEPFSFLMKHADLILTDSGGIQEEASVLGKAVLVLRTETERLEAVHAGTAKVIGVEREEIIREVELFLAGRGGFEQIARAANLFGDGRAAERIVKAILERCGCRDERVSAPMAHASASQNGAASVRWS